MDEERLVDICIVLVEEKNVRAIVPINRCLHSSVTFVTFFVGSVIAGCYNKYRYILLGAGIFVEVINRLVASRPTVKTVADIIRHELSEPQRKVLVNNYVRRLLENNDVPHAQESLFYPEDLKCNLIREIKRFLEERLGYTEFRSTLRHRP